MPDTTPSDQQLATLHRLGMATHFLNPPREGYTFSITPQQIRDLGGIRLTAVLEDGRVIIACPEEVPEVLSNSAIAIDPGTLPEAPDAPTGAEPAAKMPGFDVLTLEATVAEALAKALPASGADLSGLERKLGMLSAAVDKMGQLLAEPPAPSEPAEVADTTVIEQRIVGQGKHVAERLSKIDTQLTELAEKTAPDISVIVAMVDGISRRMDELAPDHGPLLEQIEALSGKLETMAAKNETATTALDGKLGDAMGLAQQAVTQIAGQIEALPFAPLTDHVERMANQVEALPAAIATVEAAQGTGQAAVEERLNTAMEQASTAVAQITERLDNLPFGGIVDRIDQVGRTLSDLPRPMAVGDLDPFVAKGMDRLDQLEAKVAQSSDIEGLKAALPEPPDLSHIGGQLGTISQAVSAIQGGLADAPPPAVDQIDIGPIQAALDRIEAAQNDVTALEAAIAALSDAAGVEEVADLVASRLSTSLSPPDLSAMTDQINDLSQRIDAPEKTAQLNRLVDLLERITKSPPSSSVNSQTLVRQNTALSTVVTRLELVADALSEVEHAPGTNLETIEQALTELGALQRAERIDTQDLRSKIDQMAERPVTAFDLTPLDQGMTRLEGAIATLTSFEPKEPDLRPLEACQAALLAQITDMQRNRSDLGEVRADLARLGDALDKGMIGGRGLDALTSRLETVCAGLDRLRSETNASTPDTNRMDEFIDDLRFVVAEMFALHSKAEAGDVHQLAG